MGSEVGSGMVGGEVETWAASQFLAGRFIILDRKNIDPAYIIFVITWQGFLQS